ncbi:hypothetical protein [Campylobacter coli]|uniref:hypothetical protein n=1 Tax=Campylobacter coli TaxID=195 RepID=UPI000AB4DF11|nr:hypothetical protein [Campylobacter coli]
MSKNIKTQEAKLDLITKFLDYADIADASYAMLQYVWENIEQDEKIIFIKQINLLLVIN